MRWTREPGSDAQRAADPYRRVGDDPTGQTWIQPLLLASPGEGDVVVTRDPDGASDRLEFPDGSAIVRWTADGLLSFGVHRDLVQTVPVLVDDCGVDALLSGLANEEPAYVWPAWYAAFDDTAPESLQPVV